MAGPRSSARQYNQRVQRAALFSNFNAGHQRAFQKRVRAKKKRVVALTRVAGKLISNFKRVRRNKQTKRKLYDQIVRGRYY